VNHSTGYFKGDWISCRFSS